MKLIIDIPDEDYKFIKDLQFYHSGRRSGKTIERNVINGIKNGTPLPKGHGRLKDADYIKLFSIDHDSWNGVEYEGVIKVVPVIAIDNAPTIIEADKEVDDND